MKLCTVRNVPALARSEGHNDREEKQRYLYLQGVASRCGDESDCASELEADGGGKKDVRRFE